MSDLISREAAIKSMQEAYEDTDAEYILRKIPSVCRWIPVSERLPEETQLVIVTFDACGKRQTDIRWYSSIHGFSIIDSWESVEKIVAWMPLPEPYKECTNNALKEQSNALDALEKEGE